MSNLMGTPFQALFSLTGIVLLATALGGCPGAPVTCRSSRDCAAGETCLNMSCVPRGPSPDTGAGPDAYLDLPDAAVVDDAWSEGDAPAAPLDAVATPDARLAPPDARTDALGFDSCTDGMTSGDESDVDCGGTRCVPCEDGRTCRAPTDCASAACSAGLCGPPPVSCTNGVRDGDETSADCGGSLCSPCSDGRACVLPRDCRSSVCLGALCAAPTCTDGARNATESDVDCGGGACAPCTDGRGCGRASDCRSRVCADSTCSAPSCTDRVQNGAETDTDCGGADCTGCAPGGSCMAAGDCASLECRAGVCLDCIDTAGTWTAPATCMAPACRATVTALRTGDARRLDVVWGSSFLACPTCTDAFVLSSGSISSGPSCDLCVNAAVSRVDVVGGTALAMTIEAPGCAACVETLTFAGPTVSSTGCTVAACGAQAIRSMRASGDRLELDWGDCGCTQVITFTGERTCS